LQNERESRARLETQIQVTQLLSWKIGMLDLNAAFFNKSWYSVLKSMQWLN
jgi:hypothetical protein